MGSFVYSILAVLLIDAHSSMAFRLNIHEKMTRAERFAIFGTDNGVPEYEVFSVSLPGARRRREAADNINLEVEIDGRRIILDLKPTKGYLASNYTPVWLAESDERAYNKIRYDPQPRALTDIGEFKMYHDVENEAAVTLYEDYSQGTIMEGIITANYILRSLPLGFVVENLLHEGEFLHKAIQPLRRSVVSDTEESSSTSYYVVFKNPTAPNDIKSSGLFDPGNLRRKKRVTSKGKQDVPKAFYAEMLIVLEDGLHYISPVDHNPIDVLRHALNFWNAVDLMYRKLATPKVYLTIAGLIIVETRSATPYIVEQKFNRVNAKDAVSEMGKYFYKEQGRFPIDLYDMIIAMVGPGLFVSKGGKRHYVNGYKAPNASACPSKLKVSKAKTIGNMGIVQSINGIHAAAELTASLLGAKPASKAAAPKSASEHQNMQLSISSRKDFTSHLLSKELACLRNKPVWIKQNGEVMPGRWLTMDAQCQNEGYAKACKLKGVSMCEAKGCEAKGSSKCVRTKRLPIIGTKCGTDMHCSYKKKCIGDGLVH